MEKGFDIVGDVHGCSDELHSLLEVLGYRIFGQDNAHPPERRQLILAGDMVNRGPDTPAVLQLAINMVSSGAALCVMGNHDHKLLSYWKGESKAGEELTESLAQFQGKPEAFRRQAMDFLQSLPAYLKLDDNKLIVAHAGLKESLQKENGSRAKEFAIQGELTNEVDANGKRLRYKWAVDYRGEAVVVYGHTPVREPTWLNRTINIDTGCVYGGKLTALRYPEMTLVSVNAARTYFHRRKPIV